MNPLWYVIVGLVLFGAVIGAGSLTNLTNNQTGTNTQSSDNPPATNSAERKNLQLDTFKPPTTSKNSAPAGTLPACTPGKVAYDFLLDTSYSMVEFGDGRLEAMKSAVNKYISKLSDTDIVAINSYDDVNRENLPASILKNVRSSVRGKVDSLQPSGFDAGTKARSGFARAKQTIEKGKVSFPGYTWVIIHITDGCPNGNEIPTENPDIAAEIRNSGVEIYNFGISTGQAQKCDNLKKHFGLPDDTKRPESARYLLEKISGSPDKAFVSSHEELDKLMSDKVGNLCPAATATTPALSCTSGNRPAIDILLDVSGSMENAMPDLKAAVKSFSSKLNDTDIIGIQDFSGGGPRGLLRQTIPIGKFSNSKGIFNQKIDALRHDDDGATWMRSAMDQTKDLIEDYKDRNNINDWALIFLSDGEPNVKSGDSSKENPTDVANQLKSQGVEIYTIALTTDSDRALLRKLATDDSHFFPIDSPSDLDKGFQDILRVSCK